MSDLPLANLPFSASNFIYGLELTLVQSLGKVYLEKELESSMHPSPFLVKNPDIYLSSWFSQIM